MFGKKKTEEEKALLQRLKKIHGDLVSKKYFVPDWNQSGGKNAELLLDSEQSDVNKRKYWMPSISSMNWLAIVQQQKRSLKYPLARCIEILDIYMEKTMNKTTGFKSKPCSSLHFKKYLIDCEWSYFI